MEKLKVLDIFTGIGGFTLGLERAGGFSTVAFCEIEPYPRKVLAKHWPNIPIANDVRKLTYNRKTLQLYHKDKVIYVGSIDAVSAGYPCQPFSTAGKRRGKKDDRHLWPEVNRLISECRPSWFIGENVAGHVSMGLDQVLSDLEGQGYAWEPFIIPAVSVDADHRRDRVWIIAHTLGTGVRANAGAHGTSSTQSAKLQQKNRESLPDDIESAREALAVPDSKRGDGSSAKQGANWREISERGSTLSNDDRGGLFRASANKREQNARTDRWNNIAWSGRWPAEPGVGRVANGIPARVDRLKGLGNAVVPQIPEIIGRAIISINH